MQRTELAGLILGALLVAVGVAAIYWPAGVIALGVMLLGACYDRGPRKPVTK